jgi:hypothetical protein
MGSDRHDRPKANPAHAHRQPSAWSIGPSTGWPYLLLERLAAMVEIGPHLMSGLLLGDLAAAVWLAYRDRHFRLRAEAAQVALLVAISTVWWVGHDWPGQAEHEALLALVAIGTIAGRIGQEQRNYSFSD